jgi:pyruvate ferredoxin oxidoreductase beta subunit
MAPTGKKFAKVPMWELATTSGCHYVMNMTASAPKAVAKAVREAILVAREIGPTFLNIYTPCILEIGLSANEGLGEMKDQDKDRFASYKHVSPEAEEFLKKCKAEGRL